MKINAKQFTGIIQNAEDDSIRLVKGLVKSYISSEKSLILVTIPMSGQYNTTFFN